MRKIFFIGYIFSTLSIYAQDYDREIESLAKDFEDQVIEWRHWFPANAELSNREFKTSAKITEILKDIGYTDEKGLDDESVREIILRTIGGNPRSIKRLVNSVSLIQIFSDLKTN